MRVLKPTNRRHTQIVETHHSHKRMITSILNRDDRKSQEARARFERPVWPGLFGKEVRRYEYGKKM